MDTLGGGEVYALHAAICAHHLDYQVSLAWPDNSILDPLSKFIDADISFLTTDPKAHQLLTSPGRLVEKFIHLKNYDLIFFVSDGSIPWLFGNKNLLHFQVPFANLPHHPINHIKLINQTIVCNSHFTKKHIDSWLGTNSRVIYPPVISSVSPGAKENIILGVGRFTDTLHHKRQDVLINAFKNLVDSGLNDWQLHLLGSTSPKKDSQLLTKLKKQAQGYPIKFLVNATSSQLKHSYQTAKIFWHAAGYDIDETQNPELVEHFGIVTVEAMTAGCVPVVINKGGQKEIVTHNQNGFLFDSITQLQTHTQNLINKPHLLDRFSQQATNSVKKFSNQQFEKRLSELFL